MANQSSTTPELDTVLRQMEDIFVKGLAKQMAKPLEQGRKAILAWLHDPKNSSKAPNWGQYPKTRDYFLAR